MSFVPGGVLCHGLIYDPGLRRPVTVVGPHLDVTDKAIRGVLDSLRLLANEFECQAGDDERREKERQKPLAGAPEGDDFTLGRIEGLSSARVSAIADLQGVTSRLDWRLDRVVQFDRPDTLTVNLDIVRATTDLYSDCFVRQLQRCGHC
jgi:hypothetical protein